jgi:protein-S-isoprenylcysteine O-methyltransferase Ste14
MKASAIEYRLRGLILTIIVLLGFWAPWIQALDLGKRISLLEWMALELSRAGLLRFTYATPVVIVAGALIAALGLVLRVWGAACLGPGTVRARAMRAGELEAGLQSGGPYRYVRNPLYLGTWFMIAAMSFLMPPTGALFAVPVSTIFLLRLILAEESFLAAQLGAPYQQYLRAVPRLFPRLRTSLPRTNSSPRWPIAVLTELNSVSIFITLAVLSWSYDHELMIKGIVVGFGVSIIARALVVEKPTADKAATSRVEKMPG